MDTVLGERQRLKPVLSPVLKGVYSKRKEFTPNRNKFFLFRLDRFSGGLDCDDRQIVGSLMGTNCALRVADLCLVCLVCY